MADLATFGCGGDAGIDADDGSCTPSCRAGFVCLAGECISACNPACELGEQCADHGECIATDDDGLAPIDAGASPDASTGDPRSSDDGGATNPDGGGPDSDVPDAATTDSGSFGDGGGSDAADDASVPARCPDGEFLCGGECVAPILPEVSARTPTTGSQSDGWFEAGDLAVDPCTGSLGLAYARQIERGDNWEVYATVLPPAHDGPATTPVRLTVAPGAAHSVAVVWAGDRFGVFWSDPRHDPAPESCTDWCLRELYYAAFDTSGAIVVPEVRLTNHDGDSPVAFRSYRAGSTRAAWSPEAGEIGVTWTDRGDSRQVHAAIVDPDGAIRAEQVVSAVPSSHRGSTPHIIWNDEAWQLLYRHDDSDGSQPDYLHTRRFDVSGVLGEDIDLRLPAEQIAVTARGSLGYATVTAGGSPLALRLWDLSWTAHTTLPNTTATYDGSRALAWDGDNLYLTDPDLTLEIVRYNALGTETGRIALTSESNRRLPRNLRMHRLRDRLVLMWVWRTGGLSPVVHHEVHVVETTSAM